jgi:hypothetical protein
VLEPDKEGQRSLKLNFIFEAKELHEDSLQDNSR